MIAVLLALQLAAPGPAPVVSYVDVPIEVTRVAVFEWREGAPPAPVSGGVDRLGGRVAIRGVPHRLTVVTFVRRDDQFLLDGPFAWPAADRARNVRLQWHRTIRGRIPEATPADTPFEWVGTNSMDGLWPRCFRDDPRTWACWGVGTGNRGVVVLPDAGRIWWAIVDASAAAALRSAAWGRLLVISEPAAPSDVRISFGHPVTPPAQRLRGIRLETATVSGAAAVSLGPGSAWATGGDVPPKAWAEIRTERSGPAYIPLRDIAEGSASVPLHVSLTDRRVVQGTVLGPGAEPAARALVTIFRLIDPPAPDDRRSLPRRVLAAETVTGDSGAFQVEGIGEAEYEIVAWHARFGRASVPLAAAGSDVVIHLRASGVVRGRVVAGGRPVEGAEVVSVPDAATFAAVEDITDTKGGDARTGPDGRFSVMVAATGGGELRIGGAGYGVRRVPLPRPPVPLLELGDIDLGVPIDVIVVLDRDPGCDVRAAGPIGRTGLQVIVGAREADGAYRVALPEPGLWEFGLACAAERRSLSPAVVQIGAAHSGKELRFLVR